MLQFLTQRKNSAAVKGKTHDVESLVSSYLQARHLISTNNGPQTSIFFAILLLLQPSSF